MLCITTTAASFSIRQTPLGYTTRWSSSNISFYLSPVGSDDISNGTDVSAVLQSFTDWQSISCSKLSFTNLGDTFTTAVIGNGAQPNGQNELIWVEDASWSFGQYVLGVTTPIVYQSGDIVESDIAFNGYSQQWSTTDQWGRSDVKSVAIHEIGHMFGLQHNLQGNSLAEPPTMSPAADPYGKSATLEEDDKLGACFLYPAEQQYECNGDAQCPYIVDNAENGDEFYAAKLICNIDQCAYTDGSSNQGSLGDLCSTQNDCTPPLFCQPLSTGDAYCSQYCIPEANTCPVGYECFPYADSDGGACLEAPEDVLGEGETCVGNEQCESNVCYPNSFGTWECRNPCGTDETCPAGYTCFYSPGFPTDACLPNDLVPATKVQDGYPCNSGADCESAVCVANPGTIGPKFCRSPCTPGENNCSVGWDCLELVDGSGACVPGTPPELQPEGGNCE
ncbi:MAG: matrixin family metalloprotease, partial [Myxococcota bacterium]|nr:matrixin family metalloprotease [Myxococcota bacterium]